MKNEDSMYRGIYIFPTLGVSMSGGGFKNGVVPRLTILPCRYSSLPPSLGIPVRVRILRIEVSLSDLSRRDPLSVRLCDRTVQSFLRRLKLDPRVNGSVRCATVRNVYGRCRYSDFFLGVHTCRTFPVCVSLSYQ